MRSIYKILFVWIVGAVGCNSDDGSTSESGSATGRIDGSVQESLGGEQHTRRDPGRPTMEEKFPDGSSLCQLLGPTREQLGDKIEAVFPDQSIGKIHIASDGAFYFFRDDVIFEMNVSKTSSSMVVETRPVYLFASNADTLFWSSELPSDGGEGIYSVPRNASNPTPILLYEHSDIEQLAADATHVYASNMWDNEILKIPVQGGEPTVLASPFDLNNISVQDGFVYYNEPFEPVMRVPVEGGNVETMTEGREALTFLVTSDAIYINLLYGISKIPLDGSEVIGLVRDADGRAKLLIERMWLKGDILIFNTSDHIGWTKTDGSDCEYVVYDFKGESPLPIRVELDDEYIYIADGNPRYLYRIAFASVGL